MRSPLGAPYPLASSRSRAKGGRAPPTFGGYPTQESFEPGTVTGRDVDRGIDAEPTGGLPGEHVIGDVTFEQSLAMEVPEYPVAHGVLEFAPFGWGEVRGLVELDRALGILAEHTVDDTDVEMEVSVQG